jgi:hypothetical protein
MVIAHYQREVSCAQEPPFYPLFANGGEWVVVRLMLGKFIYVKG